MGNCKRNRWIDQAQKWFDELLNADIAPTKMLCDVLRDTIGVSACNAFRERAGTPRTGHITMTTVAAVMTIRDMLMRDSEVK